MDLKLIFNQYFCMIRNIGALIFQLFIVVTMTGQTQPKSLYSAFGIGVPVHLNYGAMDGLGGTGIGLRMPYSMNNLNPAALSSIQAPFNMFLSTGLDFEALSTANKSTNEWQTSGGLTHYDMWFRIGKNFTTTFAVSPFTEVNYNIISEERFEPTGKVFNITNEGDGGINQVRLNQTWSPYKFLHVGISGILYFGTIRETENVTDLLNSGEFVAETKTAFNDVNYELGLQFEFPVNRSKISFGGVYRPTVNLLSDQDFILQTISEEIEEEIAVEEKFLVPMRYGGGIGFQSENWLFGADATFEQWSDMNELNRENLIFFNDVFGVSVGSEYTLYRPNSNSRLSASQLRAGFGIKNSYLNIDNQEFLVWQITLGYGFPISKFKNRVNINYKFSHQGKISNTLVRDVTHTIGLSVDLRNVWFAKRLLN